MMTCPYCGPVEPRRTIFQIKKPEPGELVMDWCPKCTAVIKPSDVAKDFQAKPDHGSRLVELAALRDAAAQCDCGQECYCARNFEYAEAELEKLGVDPTQINARR